MFLTSPYIDQALAQACAICSPPPKGLPDSSDPTRHHGVQGQVLAITVVPPESVSWPRCCPLRDSIGSTSAYPALPCGYPVPPLRGSCIFRSAFSVDLKL